MPWLFLFLCSCLILALLVMIIISHDPYHCSTYCRLHFSTNTYSFMLLDCLFYWKRFVDLLLSIKSGIHLSTIMICQLDFPAFYCEMYHMPSYNSWFRFSAFLGRCLLVSFCQVMATIAQLHVSAILDIVHSCSFSCWAQSFLSFALETCLVRTILILRKSPIHLFFS